MAYYTYYVCVHRRASLTRPPSLSPLPVPYNLHPAFASFVGLQRAGAHTSDPGGTQPPWLTLKSTCSFWHHEYRTSPQTTCYCPTLAHDQLSGTPGCHAVALFDRCPRGWPTIVHRLQGSSLPGGRWGQTPARAQSGASGWPCAQRSSPGEPLEAPKQGQHSTGTVKHRRGTAWV